MNSYKKTILVIEDEPDIRDLLEFHLKKEGYKVLTSNDGEKGLKTARRENPNLIILDLLLPGIKGLDVCRVLKNDVNTSKINIIMVTALGQEENIVKGLETGADDYVSKPFNMSILLARISAVLRRNTTNAISEHDNVQINEIKIIPRLREVTAGQKKITDLTFTEFQILHLLATHPGWVFTRYQIIDKIRGDNYPVTDRSVDFQIVGLRKKLGDHGKLIETIRGVGYRFRRNES
jgi:two-component system alkaline phosphatase synthesis response regulator PhoP